MGTPTTTFSKLVDELQQHWGAIQSALASIAWRTTTKNAPHPSNSPRFRTVSSVCRSALLGVRCRNVRLHIRVVIGSDLPFAFVLHHDLQQACAEPSLVVRIRSGRQLLNPGH